MYIPKKTRLEMFLKRKSSTSSRKNSNKNNNNNWSETCTGFIKDVLLKRRTSSKKSIESGDTLLFNDPNLCFDQLSEFQKSYVSFPEFSDSTISAAESATDSECSTNTQESKHWGLPTSFSFSSYSSSHI
jgi:hypothetical protein